MSLVHSGVVLQALSIFTGATVKPFSEDVQSGDNLDIFNFLPTIFANKPLQAFSSFTGATVNSFADDTQGGVNLGHLSFYPNPSYTDATDAEPQKIKELTVDMANFLDPGYDFDFTDLTDDSACMRGNEEYKRPCGWKRIAIKVLDKYPDGNAWLGSAGWRSYSVDGEWPVSYHGTHMNNVEPILRTQYKPGHNNAFGRGIYSTNDINVATAYSKEVKCEVTGKTYKVILQNRINPKMRKKYGYGGKEDYWLIKVPEGITSDEQIAEIVQKSLRPYGILFKEV